MDLFFAMDGVLMSVALARLYAKYGLRVLNHLSPTSYTIYLYHGIFQALSLQILMRYTHFDNVVLLVSDKTFLELSVLVKIGLNL